MSDNPSSEKRGSDGLTDQERAEIKARSDRLGDELENFRSRPSANRPPPKTGGSALGQALRMAVDPVVGVLVGVGLGVLADDALGTKPLCLIVGLIIGGAAGMWNLVRSAERTARGKPEE
ncbi:MAG: AtpZ/AtpI family protein [Pseudomonadota bacterium]